MYVSFFENGYLNLFILDEQIEAREEGMYALSCYKQKRREKGL